KAFQARLRTVREINSRALETVRVIVVTKFHPVSEMQQAIAAGVTEIGENRVQEAASKKSELAGSHLRWHGIGQLQTNKAKTAIEVFDELHGIDRIELVDKLGRASAELQKTVACYLQVNVTGKVGQGGCSLSDIPRLLDSMNGYPFLKPVGLMCIASLEEEVGVVGIRNEFAAARSLRDQMITEQRLPEYAGLSMGMSGDWEYAIAEGATLIRIGTAIMGNRS
ncbi:MAG: YggS family pyridoxal phosphate-dependent enzyme, partial [bacterium]|nr:YggS family pyridoxal phosphate-dependent enzyme [bacterium]